MYKTFAAALLAAVIEAPKRQQALNDATKEPTYTKDAEGRRIVTFNEPSFTLIVCYHPNARVWGFSWTWTDAA